MVTFSQTGFACVKVGTMPFVRVILPDKLGVPHILPIAVIV